jgi:hypothetical protein
MGNKNAPKREKKKPAKTKPKAAPGRSRDDFSQTTARIAREATDKA